MSLRGIEITFKYVFWEGVSLESWRTFLLSIERKPWGGREKLCEFLPHSRFPSFPDIRALSAEKEDKEI